MNYNSTVYILVWIGEGLHLIKGLLITFIKEAIGRAIVEGTGIPQLTSEIGTEFLKLSNVVVKCSAIWPPCLTSVSHLLPLFSKSWAVVKGTVTRSPFATSYQWLIHWLCLSETVNEDHKWWSDDCRMLQCRNWKLVTKHSDCCFVTMRMLRWPQLQTLSTICSGLQ